MEIITCEAYLQHRVLHRISASGETVSDVELKLPVTLLTYWNISSCVPTWDQVWNLLKKSENSNWWQTVDPQPQMQTLQTLQPCEKIPTLSCQAAMPLTASNSCANGYNDSSGESYSDPCNQRHMMSVRQSTLKHTRSRGNWVPSLTECDKDNAGTISEQSADEGIGVPCKSSAILRLHWYQYGGQVHEARIRQACQLSVITIDGGFDHCNK